MRLQNQSQKPNSFSPIRIKRHERGIWQQRLWEHTIVIEADNAMDMDGRRMAQAYPPYSVGFYHDHVAMLP